MQGNTAANVKDVLVEHGISPSFHRLRIYEYLMNNKTHPNADSIYKEIIEVIPTLSKATIYNTMRTFVAKGIIQEITIEENEVRFDADVSRHAHLKCTECGSLYDIFPGSLGNAADVFNRENIDGHIINETQIYFRGVCSKCQ